MATSFFFCTFVFNMKLAPKLEQKQRLGQQLSPQQVRFVRLLEMSGPEIEEEVRHELDDNPALEVSDSDADDIQAESFGESSDDMQAADYGSPDDIPEYLLHARNHSADDPSPRREQSEDSPTLVEDLNRQLDMVESNPRLMALARYLTGYLDDNGRITRSLSAVADDIAINLGVEVTRSELAEALDIIKYRLDPPGVGAVDLRECLMIQLKRKTPKTLPLRAAEEIITDNFDLFSKRHFDRLKAALGVDDETFDSALKIIRGLDPKPGSSHTGSDNLASAHITPDFTVLPMDDEQDRFSIIINQHIPALSIQESFKIDAGNQTDRVYIRKKRDEAGTFISLIERRSRTLMAVMKAIVAIQHQFFITENPADLRPMILKDISNATGLDLSVISRATSNKYVATQGGIYPLKMFFNDRPVEDSDLSSAEIAEALRTMIDEEDKKHPLSDRVITDKLNEKGYPIARRTVAKYREKLEIPVARLRKEY